VKCLLQVDPRYKPTQRDPIHKLLGKLNALAEVFLGCLKQQSKGDNR
jgi:hypothetical protein